MGGFPWLRAEQSPPQARQDGFPTPTLSLRMLGRCFKASGTCERNKPEPTISLLHCSTAHIPGGAPLESLCSLPNHLLWLKSYLGLKFMYKFVQQPSVFWGAGGGRPALILPGPLRTWLTRSVHTPAFFFLIKKMPFSV